MLDENTGGGETAPAGDAGEVSQGGVTEAGAQTQTQTPQEWKVGDTTFKSPGELHQGALRWQGDFTRVSQRLSGMEKELGGYKAVFQIVANDPRLAQEVRARMQAGQSQQQAVQQTAQAHPEMLQKVGSLEEKIQKLEQARTIDEQDRAQYEFKQKHQDVKDEEWTAMANFIGQNHKWFGPEVTPTQMIEMAYHSVVLPQRYEGLQKQGLQQTQEETVKRVARPLLGSQAASAGTRAPDTGKPKGKLTPAQEREYANKVFAKNKVTQR